MEGSTAAAGTFPRIGSIIGGAIALMYARALSPAAGSTAQVKTVTVSAQTSGQTYGHIVTPFGGAAQTISVVATDTTPATLIAQIVAAHKANTYANGAVACVAASSTTYTLTDRTPGVNVSTIAEVDPDTKLSIANTTAGADATSFTFGRYAPISTSATTGDHTVAQPSVLVGPVLTLTIGHAATSTYAATVTATDPLGVTQVYELAWSSDSTAALTDDAAEAEVLAEFGATLVTIANPSTGSVTVTFPIGYTVDVSGVTRTGSGSTLAAAVTAGATVPVPGLILRDGEVSPTGAVKTTSIAGTSPLCLYARPAAPIQITVEDPGAAVTAGAPVWIDSTTGAPRAAAAPGRYMHATHTWVGRNLQDLFGNTIAVVEAR